MSGRRMKKLRKKALELYPDGSTLSIDVTKTFQGQPVAGRFLYGGYRRAYQNLKRGIHVTKNPEVLTQDLTDRHRDSADPGVSVGNLECEHRTESDQQGLAPHELRGEVAGE
jgi:hypothetical protein